MNKEHAHAHVGVLFIDLLFLSSDVRYTINLHQDSFVEITGAD